MAGDNDNNDKDKDGKNNDNENTSTSSSGWFSWITSGNSDSDKKDEKNENDNEGNAFEKEYANNQGNKNKQDDGKHSSFTNGYSDNDNSSTPSPKDSAHISYENYIPTAIDQDFLLPTIACAVLCCLLLYPLVACRRRHLRSSRRLKSQVQQMAAADAEQLTGMMYVPMADDSDNNNNNNKGDGEGAHRGKEAMSLDHPNLGDILSAMDLFVEHLDGTDTRCITLQWNHTLGNEERLHMDPIVMEISGDYLKGYRSRRVYRKALGRYMVAAMLNNSSNNSKTQDSLEPTEMTVEYGEEGPEASYHAMTSDEASVLQTMHPAASSLPLQIPIQTTTLAPAAASFLSPQAPNEVVGMGVKEFSTSPNEQETVGLIAKGDLSESEVIPDVTIPLHTVEHQGRDSQAITVHPTSHVDAHSYSQGAVPVTPDQQNEPPMLNSGAENPQALNLQESLLSELAFRGEVPTLSSATVGDFVPPQPSQVQSDDSLLVSNARGERDCEQPKIQNDEILQVPVACGEGDGVQPKIQTDEILQVPVAHGDGDGVQPQRQSDDCLQVPVAHVIVDGATVEDDNGDDWIPLASIDVHQPRLSSESVARQHSSSSPQAAVAPSDSGDAGTGNDVMDDPDEEQEQSQIVDMAVFDKELISVKPDPPIVASFEVDANDLASTKTESTKSDAHEEEAGETCKELEEEYSLKDDVSLTSIVYMTEGAVDDDESSTVAIPERQEDPTPENDFIDEEMGEMAVNNDESSTIAIPESQEDPTQESETESIKEKTGETAVNNDESSTIAAIPESQEDPAQETEDPAQKTELIDEETGSNNVLETENQDIKVIAMKSEAADVEDTHKGDLIEEEEMPPEALVVKDEAVESQDGTATVTTNDTFQAMEPRQLLGASDPPGHKSSESSLPIATLEKRDDNTTIGDHDYEAFVDDQSKDGSDTDLEPVMEYTRGCHTCALVMNFDFESKRIFALAAPSAVGSITSAITSTVATALISYNMGTENYVAYIMVFVLLGFCAATYSGIAEAKSLLVAQAIGAGDPFLAGQYEQAGLLLENVCAVPLYIGVYFLFPNLIALLGLEQEVAREYSEIICLSID
jgi:MatE